MKTFALALTFAASVSATKLRQSPSLLAEIQGAHDTPTCTRTFDRIKAGNPVDVTNPTGPQVDFWAVYDGTTKYVDESFTPEWALSWAPLYAETTYSHTFDSLYDKFGSSKTLWGSDGITPADVRQGGLGDCWFLAAASAIAEVPHRMEKMFLNDQNELKANGIYGVNMYTLGVPNTIIVDDLIPLRRNSDGSAGGTVFTHWGGESGARNAAWMPILEKVFAKYHGNYAHLSGGWMDAAVRSLWGSPSKSIWHDPATMTVEDLDALWLELQGHDFANEIVTSAALSRSTGCNLVKGHAYTTLSVLELTDGTRLVKVRNPWGSEQWTCDWRDTDNVNWTAERRAEAETAHTQENSVNDGVFWVSFADYV